MYKIGELSKIVNVKAGTIRFYEKCGFLEPVDRLPNRYRIYNDHHIYQIRICRLVFGGFVSRSLRKTSLKILEAAGGVGCTLYQEAGCQAGGNHRRSHKELGTQRTASLSATLSKAVLYSGNGEPYVPDSFTPQYRLQPYGNFAFSSKNRFR